MGETQRRVLPHLDEQQINFEIAFQFVQTRNVLDLQPNVGILKKVKISGILTDEIFKGVLPPSKWIPETRVLSNNKNMILGRFDPKQDVKG
uniref:Uncharacterized protein n=1 Tax=Romanomermis culicivorax TaxID=13658 RepID=A0A915J5B9_ROMCU